jgi:outer membrane protein TolC
MEFNELFTGPSEQWSFGPAVTVPIFSGGRNTANLDLAEIRRDKAVASYELAVQTAFREAADALSNRENRKALLDASLSRLATQRRVLSLAESRYLGGASSYLEVLDAQREVFEAEMDFLDARKSYLSSSVSLYAALGGGLEPGGLPDPPKTPGKPPNRPEEKLPEGGPAGAPGAPDHAAGREAPSSPHPR